MLFDPILPILVYVGAFLLMWSLGGGRQALRILIWGPVLGGVIGVIWGLSGSDEGFIDTSRGFTFGVYGATIAFALSVVTILAWLFSRRRKHLRRLRALMVQTRDLSTDADLQNPDLLQRIEMLEASAPVKFIPCTPVSTDRAWAFEEWVEAIEDENHYGAFVVVPLRSRLRLYRAKPGAHAWIEPWNPRVAVLFAPQKDGRRDYIVTASDEPFCRTVAALLRP